MYCAPQLKFNSALLHSAPSISVLEAFSLQLKLKDFEMVFTPGMDTK